MGLAEYHRKRNFQVTPEPRGRVEKHAPGLFVIQKHDASHLHYDFRLELDGVLKSWSIPRGPSLDPKVKRLAMPTEDHPVDYADFEGVIPEGEYGGGTVMIWDRGTWSTDENPREALGNGRLTFTLKGQKLHGRWRLIRVGKTRGSRGGAGWLLIKSRDQHAREESAYDVTVAKPNSVTTRRSLDAIAGARSRERPAKGGRSRVRATVTKEPAPNGHARAKRNGATPHDFHGVRITHPDRVIYPEQGLTKRDLAEYYEAIADEILPHLHDRPLTMIRCPEGRTEQCFVQKHTGRWKAPQLRVVTLRERNKTGEYVIAESVPGLVALVQHGVLELHTWNAVARHVDQPDRLVFDLDPDPGMPWRRVVDGAWRMRQRLESLGLESFVKTTGGKGLHVVVPIQRGPSWDACADFARAVAEDLTREDPRGYTADASKSVRKGRIFIDYLRNTRGATSVAAFSPRARKHAPVSVPIHWDELTVDLRSDAFTVRNVLERLQRLRKDPWERYPRVRQRITVDARREIGLG
ncbi:MAG: non-homologous end-joining DNA ligase [Myxococcota bacterium]